ncbi:hypothetical protein BGZ68_000668 [Mortierella alpina]|nr:hypothetical protein BGZ68_000668 [Mortierella alpina]
MRATKTVFTCKFFLSLIVASLWVGFVRGQAIADVKLRWPHGVVSYVVDHTLSNDRHMILSAMQEFEQHTCIRFQERTTEANYIRFFEGQGCYSYTGMIGGRQDLSLGYGCLEHGTILSELATALGLVHEHNRSDRDDYLLVLFWNVQPWFQPQFKKLSPSQNTLYGPFNYKSITLWGSYHFSMNKDIPVMIPKAGVVLSEPKDKANLSYGDISNVRKMYDCPWTPWSTEAECFVL